MPVADEVERRLGEPPAYVELSRSPRSCVVPALHAAIVDDSSCVGVAMSRDNTRASMMRAEDLSALQHGLADE